MPSEFPQQAAPYLRTKWR